MSLYYNENKEIKGVNVGVTIVLGVATIVAILMFVLPLYSVWSSSQAGRAALAHADFERQVQVVNAQANLQAQKFNADAEVARAE